MPPRTVVKPRDRRPAVAGYCYPGTPELLEQELSRWMRPDLERVPARGVIVPHAGFRYSAAVAGEAFSRITIPRRSVLIGSNHTGRGPSWSVMAAGAYQTPLGGVPVDEPLAEALRAVCPILVEDEDAQLGEHAIEVVLPFLQRAGPADLTIVPIITASQDVEELEQVAEALADVVSRSEEPVLVVASAEFTAYEPAAVTSRNDGRLIAALKELDASRFLQEVRAVGAVMCGVGPIACVVRAVRRLGATEARLVRYATSADAGGDPSSAVGYAGIILN